MQDAELCFNHSSLFRQTTRTNALTLAPALKSSRWIVITSSRLQAYITFELSALSVCRSPCLSAVHAGIADPGFLCQYKLKIFLQLRVQCSKCTAGPQAQRRYSSARAHRAYVLAPKCTPGAVLASTLRAFTAC